jgi:hypothetical protein
MSMIFRGVFSGCLAAVALTGVAVARADSGDGVGIGPLFAFSVNAEDSVAIGWEAAASVQGPFSKATLGGSYYLSSRKGGAGDMPGFHYLAWEPWYIVGATLGVAATNRGDVLPYYGLWDGLLGSVSGDNLTSLYDDEGLHWAVSLTAGWRGVGSRQEFYFTPKVWRIRGWDFFT